MSKPTTTDGLRNAIDHGRGQAKVDFTDPSAAPLGTDEEAAGTPVTASDVAHAASHEVGRAPQDRPGDTAERDRRNNEGASLPRWFWLLAGFVVLAGVAFAVAAGM